MDHNTGAWVCLGNGVRANFGRGQRWRERSPAFQMSSMAAPWELGDVQDKLCPWFPHQRGPPLTTLCPLLCSLPVCKLMNWGLFTKCQPFSCWVLEAERLSSLLKFCHRVLVYQGSYLKPLSIRVMRNAAPPEVLTLTGSYSEANVTFNCSIVPNPCKVWGFSYFINYYFAFI